jgi:hypothetical protein
MTEVSSALDEGAGNIPVWVAIPPGYFPLPLADVDSRLAQAESILTGVADVAQQPVVHGFVGVLGVFLADLAARGTLYCGIGRHISPADESVVTSSLIVSLLEFPGARNPRLVLADLVRAKSGANERGQADLVDVLERPTLFFERTRQLPTPQLPGRPDVPGDAMSPVFQLEAFVPSSDGGKLAIIEFSTPAESHGPQFRAMIVEMAASVSFEPPAADHGFSSKIGEVLG